MSSMNEWINEQEKVGNDLLTSLLEVLIRLLLFLIRCKRVLSDFWSFFVSCHERNVNCWRGLPWFLHYLLLCLAVLMISINIESVDSNGRVSTIPPHCCLC